VTCDVTGFLASVYMRGVESSNSDHRAWRKWTPRLAEKTGRQLQSGKNLIGTFYQPLTVLIDPNGYHAAIARVSRGASTGIAIIRQCTRCSLRSKHAA